MKLPKYNLGYNTRDQLRSLAISASERKHETIVVYAKLFLIKLFTPNRKKGVFAILVVLR